jgi:hypothetical protein
MMSKQLDIFAIGRPSYDKMITTGSRTDLLVGNAFGMEMQQFLIAKTKPNNK